MTRYDIANVSRETSEKLRAFASLVEKWNPTINLVSKASLPDLWERHILDSVQVYDIASGDGHWVDIGSGGGFPGMVVAILNGEETRFKVTLVESDQRKCTFLRTALRELDIAATIQTARIETMAPQKADVLSARALADLSKLLDFANRHLLPTGTALFSKGENWKSEQEEAQRMWSYECEAITSKTNPAAAVLKIKDIARV